MQELTYDIIDACIGDKCIYTRMVDCKAILLELREAMYASVHL